MELTFTSGKAFDEEWKKCKELGCIFVKKGLITEEQLQEALDYQKKFGGRIGWILSSLGYIKRTDYFEALAYHFKLDFINDIDKIIKLVDKELIRRFDPQVLIDFDLVPARYEDGKLVVLTSYPNTKKIFNFRDKYFPGSDLRQIVITDLDLKGCLDHFFKSNIVDRTINGLFYLNPKYSASIVFSKFQFILLYVFLLVLIFGLYYNLELTLYIMVGFIQIVYIVAISFKFFVSFSGSKAEMEEFITEDELKALNENELPIYTILIPAYKEPEVIPHLIESIKRIDYPKNKLDIILLLEEDDKETYEVAKKSSPPLSWRFLIVPNSIPKTKPKACNYGLFFAKGKYLTIYDAEDIPEPDQLKKAVIAFSKTKGQYICFQAALNYFNKDENFLTKMFTLEYSYWFDYLLPGLFKLNFIIPLGGTSNHFDVEKLREIGGWDPFNTTEDADIGVRAFVRGYKVGVINSTTYEEANSRLKNWIRQRSRWIKGYMQTFLVHCRNIFELYRKIGFRGIFSFFLLIGGTPLMFLINPLMWFSFLFWWITRSVFYETIFVDWVLYLSIFNLLFGNFIGIYLNLLAVFKRRYYSLIPYVFLNPIYWVLHSIASYLALYELFTKPFYWQKTQHGITKFKPKVELS